MPWSADRAQHLRVGHRQALVLGQRSGAKLVAHHRRHSGPIFRQEGMGARQLLQLRRDRILDAEDESTPTRRSRTLERSRHARVGTAAMTDTEYRSPLQLLGTPRTPLIAGNDLRDMKPEIHDILTNQEVIAVNQDPLGRQGRRVWERRRSRSMSKPLAGGRRASSSSTAANRKRKSRRSGRTSIIPTRCRLRTRLVAKEGSRKSAGQFSASVAPHAVVMVTLAP